MGHDISSINKAGEEVGYVRFTAWDMTASWFYHLFDASDYNAGVSGSGNSVTMLVPQIEQALKTFEKTGHYDPNEVENDFSNWQLGEIFNFIQACLTTAKNEGNVRVFFG